MLQISRHILGFPGEIRKQSIIFGLNLALSITVACTLAWKQKINQELVLIQEVLNSEKNCILNN